MQPCNSMPSRCSPLLRRSRAGAAAVVPQELQAEDVGLAACCAISCDCLLY